MSMLGEYKIKRAHVIIAALALGLNTLLGALTAAQSFWSSSWQRSLREQEIAADRASLEYTLAIECESAQDGTLVEWLEVRNVGGARAESVVIIIRNTGREVLEAHSELPYEQVEPELRQETAVLVGPLSLNSQATYRLELALANYGGLGYDEARQLLALQAQSHNLEVTTGSNTLREPRLTVEEPRGFPELVTHIVADAETIYSIADQYGVSEDLLVWYNPAINLGNDPPIVPGQSLVIQPSVCGQQGISSITSPQGWSIMGYHTIQPGETLFCIARAYGVDPWAIAAMNGIVNPSLVADYFGQVLAIPAMFVTLPSGPVCARQFQTPTASCVTYHTIQPDESLYRVALMYGVSMWRIAEANGISSPDDVQQGDSLCIPAP